MIIIRVAQLICASDQSNWNGYDVQIWNSPTPLKNSLNNFFASSGHCVILWIIAYSHPQVVSIDIIGQFVASDHGNAFVAVIIDMFTKYTIAIPLRDTTVADLVSALQTSIYQQGPPRKFVSDQSEEFIKEVSCNLTWKLITQQRLLQYRDCFEMFSNYDTDFGWVRWHLG